MGTWSLIEGEGASITQNGLVTIPSLPSGVETKTYKFGYTSDDGKCTCTHIVTQSSEPIPPTPTGGCVLVGNNQMGDITLTRNGGDVTFNAFGCGGGCMFYIKNIEHQMVNYTFALLNPPEHYYYYGKQAYVRATGGGGDASRMTVQASTDGIIVSYDLNWAEYITGNYTLVFDDSDNGIHCETPFTIEYNPCDMIDIRHTDINVGPYQNRIQIYDFYSYSIDVEAQCTAGCDFVYVMGSMVQIHQNTTGQPRTATIEIRVRDTQTYQWKTCGTVTINQSE